MKAFWRHALFLARFDLKYLLRQKETLMWTFLMPGLFFYFIGTVTGGAGFAPDVNRPTPLELELPYAVPFELSEPLEGQGVRDWSDDPILEALVGRLEDENFSVRLLHTDGDSREPSDDTERATKRLVWPALPSGYATWSDALAAGERARPMLLANRAGTGATFDELRVNTALYGLLADLVVLERNGEGFSGVAFADLGSKRRAIQLDERPAGARATPPIGFEQTIPGTMVMFTMMILLTGGSILLIQERNAGLFRRLASSPIPVLAVLVGKWLARMALAVIQISFSMVLGAWLFGMDWGASLPAVCVLLFLWGSFCAGLSLFLATVARTEGQMTGLAIIGTMVLAALGGCWWPIEVTPGWMQDLASFLPTGWAMGAMHDLVHFGHGARAALPEFALLAGGTALLLLAGARRFRFD